MKMVRHGFGLTLAALIGAGFWAAWIYYPDLTWWEPIRPYRGFLVEWRLPILGVGGFLILTLAEWAFTKTLGDGGHHD